MANDYEGYLFAAANDARAIDALASLDIEAHSEVIAFHAQQMAEKLMKSVFVQNEEVPPKTHSIDALLRHAIERNWLGRGAESLIEVAAELSQYAVLARYVQTPDIGRGEALAAIVDCQKLVAMLCDEGYEVVPLCFRAHGVPQEGGVG